MHLVDLPSSFRAPVWLERLNILAVGASLAACTGVLLVPMNLEGILTGSEAAEGEIPAGSMMLHAGAASALSTFLFALVWARLLRVRHSWIGWAACVPLAAITSATACALCAPNIGNFVLGATLGAFVWVPALCLTLVFFGLPLYFARAAAERGISSEDRGELAVGIVAALLAALALVLDVGKVGIDAVVIAAFGATAMLAGTSAAVASWLRERERRLFLAEVREGRAAEFRIEETAKTAMVVRVSEVGHAYRGTTMTEPVVLLDESGDTKSRLSI